MTVPASTHPANYFEVESNNHFQELLGKDLQRTSLVSFWAPWAEPCKQMNEVVLELAKKYPDVLVLQVHAENLPDISESFEVEAVPSFVILRGHTLLGRISGADAPALTAALAQHTRVAPAAQSKTSQAPAPAADARKEEETPEQLNERLRTLMNLNKVVLFMKGSPDAPRCGFSRQTVELLRANNVPFSHFDILTDESVRQGLKTLNNWPTFPQLIVKGELVGGLDIVREMVDSGEFQEVLAN
ncbi:glutaredoxin [Auricularia subglabra TFB-10046 SS5]|nr:glutaredoxin [Auricularia subglabra TFB-10046 SS5]